MKFFSALVFLFALGVCAPAQENVPAQEGRAFVRAGEFLGTVFIAPDASDAEFAAAQDLATWIARVGETKPIGVKSETFFKGEKFAIFVGETAAAKKAGIAPLSAGVESYTIMPRGDALYIIGKTPIATHHAVGEFLKTQLGVHFLFPSDDGAEWEPKKNIFFPQEPIVCVPAWTWRNLWLIDTTWARRLGFGELPEFSHNFYNIFTKEAYKKHPELYPILDGVAWTLYSGAGTPAPNLSVPAAKTVAIEAAKTFFEKKPNAPLFSLGINDSSVWDESVNSGGDVPAFRWFRNLPDRSDYYYSFVNAVAKEFPKKRIGVIAYLDVQNVPAIPIEKNVVPVLCADRSMWVFPEFKAQDKALIADWARAGADFFGIYDYYYGSPFLFPRIFFKEQAETLRFAHEQGARLFFAEAVAVPAFDAPKVWLTANLLKNPQENPQTILDDFYARAYGDAREPMKKFFELCEKIWREQGGQCRWLKGWNCENSVAIFSLDACETLRACLNAAKKAVAAPETARARRQAARIDATLAHFTRAEKFARAYHAREALRHAKFETPEAIVGTLRNPAWRMEEMFDDAAFESLKNRSNLAHIRVGDPRAGTLFRLVEALKKMPESEARAGAEARLAELLESAAPDAKKPADRALARCRAMVPIFAGTPFVEDDFEPTRRRGADGEWEKVPNFELLSSVDWRAGKTVCKIKNWEYAISPAENLSVVASRIAHSGTRSLRVSGGCEQVAFLRDFNVPAGKKSAAARIWARGRISVGAEAKLSFSWENHAGKPIGVPVSDRLPVGDTEAWLPLIVLDDVPACAEKIRISISIFNQAPGDSVFFDDFSLYLY